MTLYILNNTSRLNNREATLRGGAVFENLTLLYDTIL